jgi:hypothetical protein
MIRRGSGPHLWQEDAAQEPKSNSHHTRRPGTPQPTEGERRKLEAHEQLEARRELHILRGRRALLQRLLDVGEATADDVRRAVELPAEVNPVCLGAVPAPLAYAGIIERAGYAVTSRAEAHARPVSRWRLVDRAAAIRWLDAHPDRADPEPEDDLPLFAAGAGR